MDGNDEVVETKEEYFLYKLRDKKQLRMMSKGELANLVINLIDKYQASEKLLDRALAMLAGEDDADGYECVVSTFDEEGKLVEIKNTKEQWKLRLAVKKDAK